MGVIIGSARIDEFGNTSGGQAGDQTGKEVSTQNFYIHKRGWFVLRPKSKAEELGDAMDRACNNDNFGYDQGNRLDCLKYTTKATKPTECDCSSLLRLCIKETFGKDVGNFTTFNEAQVLENSGLFEKRIPYEEGKTSLYKGDVLVTKTKGHTAIVTKSDNVRIEEIKIEAVCPYAKSLKVLSRGINGDNVKYLQCMLNFKGFATNIDGDFGPATENSVKKFQKKMGLEVDGVVGKNTWSALLKK